MGTLLRTFSLSISGIAIWHYIKFLLTIVFCCAMLPLAAQVGTMAQVNLHQSPDAASLGKYVEVPVGHYSGIPQISVPLYEIKANGLTVPISLSYHASGIKVKDVPGWVGSGFSLFAGGVINRIVRGMPDDHDPYVSNDADDNYNNSLKGRIKLALANGFTTEFNVNERYKMARSTPGIVVEDVASYVQRVDVEYDLFYFNFGDNVGQFTFNNEGYPMLLSGNDLKIEYNLRKFKITDANGVEYYFDAIEQSLNENSSMRYYSGGRMYTTSWFMSKMRSPINGAEINFTYKSYNNSELYDQSQLSTYANAFVNTVSRLKINDLTDLYTNYIYGNNSDCPVYEKQYNLNLPHNFSTALFLDEITWNDNNKIKFYGELNRQDLYKYKLDSVNVMAGANVLRKIKFQYGYFNKDHEFKKYKRLKLDKVYINDEKYEFGYINYFHGMSTPPIDSRGQDLWGYYNGEDENLMLGGNFYYNDNSKYHYEPNYKFYDLNNDGSLSFYIPYRNSTFKNPDAKYAQLGMLSSIKFPTGGKTEFTYEGNDYSTFPCSWYSRIEDDPYINIKLDSSYTKQCRAITPFSGGTQEPNGTRNFVLHYDQTVSLTGLMGIGNITFAQYNTYIANGHPIATLRLQKYNDQLSQFENIENLVISPVDSIGFPTTIPQYESVKLKGSKFINKTRFLTEGRYRIICDIYGIGLVSQLSINAKFNYKKSAAIYNAGGLRIKKIAFTSGTEVDSSYVKSYEYKDGVNSTGALESPFANIYHSAFVGLIEYSQDMQFYKQSVCEFLNFNSDPIIPLGNSKGGVIGYTKVTEKKEDNSKVTYHFTNGNEPLKADVFIKDQLVYALTGVDTDNSWKRGLLKQIDYYNSTNGLVKQNFKQYYFLNNYNQRSVSMFMNRVDIAPLNVFSVDPWFITRYNNYSLIKTDSTVVYNGNGNLVNVESYEYDINKHRYPNKITSTLSDGSKTIVNLKYPQDYTFTVTPTDTIAKGISTMLFRHVVSPVVEKYVQRQDANGSNLRTVSADLSVYKPTVPLPYVNYALETTSALTNFSSLNVSSSSVVKDSRYKPVGSVGYDNYGNIAQLNKVGSAASAYLWDYNNSILIAEVNNAKTADIAYTGFEADGKGSWSFTGTALSIATPVGNKAYGLASGPISKTGLSSGMNYVLAYWRKNDATVTVTGGTVTAETSKRTVAGWAYVERTISGTTSITISGTGNIDELRLHPSGAQMITYTYTPLIGLSTKTDAKGETTYYDYDSYGRLKGTKDQQGSIIKSYNYNYKP